MPSPIDFLREAIKAVPAVKYALGVGGIVASVALIYSFKLDPRVAFVGTLVILILMGVLVIFARMVALAGPRLFLPAIVFTWFVLLLFMATCLSLFSSVFFQKPLNLGHWLTPTATATSQLPAELQLFTDSDWVNGGSSIDSYCNEYKGRYELQYPGRVVVIADKKEDHKTEWTPFKHDYYRYQCWFVVK